MSQLELFPEVPALFKFDYLSNYVKFGRSRIYGLIAEGKFPAPVKVGKSSRWVKSEIDSWLSEQITARSAHKAEHWHGSSKGAKPSLDSRVTHCRVKTSINEYASVLIGGLK